MAKAKYKRGADGYFQTRVWDGTYTAAGKKKYISVRSKKSSRDLESKVAEFNRNREERNGVKKTDQSFLDYARLWKALYKSGKSANTLAMYENIIEKHLSMLGGVRLQDISRVHIQTVINHADGHARTQQQIYMTCKQVLRSAAADQLFPANVVANIFSNLERPGYSASEKRPLASYEQKAVFEADFEEQDRVFVYLIYGCGLRRGETLALTIFDFSLADHTVTVSKAHEFTQKAPRQKDPKSDHGFRTIPIPDRTFGTIKKRVQNVMSSGGTYLFQNMDGDPLTLSDYEKMWRRILKAMQAVSDQKIEGLTAHIFRHNYCTTLCYQIPSISIKHIAYLLGDTEKMVFDVYNHIILEKENAAKVVSAAL